MDEAVYKLTSIINFRKSGPFLAYQLVYMEFLLNNKLRLRNGDELIPLKYFTHEI